MVNVMLNYSEYLYAGFHFGEYCYGECHYDEFCYAECRCAEYCYGECHHPTCRYVEIFKYLMFSCSLS
jgi:hypothetical protein